MPLLLLRHGRVIFPGVKYIRTKQVTVDSVRNLSQHQIAMFTILFEATAYFHLILPVIQFLNF